MYQYILFDLDGTLTDPKEGIIKSFQYALKEEFGIEEKNPDRLEHIIGPPLRGSFLEFGVPEEDLDRAVEKYRERYRPTGVYENQIYPGMYQLLHDLKKQGKILAVASSKPIEFVHIVLQKFEIEDCFTVIVGSERDGQNESKIEVMERAIEQLKKRTSGRMEMSKVLMVGDRKYDMEGAHHFGLDSVAVRYGYAPEGELEAAGATYMVDDVITLGEIIEGEPSYFKYRGKSSLVKTCEILYPLLAFWVIELIVFNVLYYFLEKQIHFNVMQKDQLNVYLNAVASIAVWPFLSFLYRKSAPVDTSHVITRRKKTRLKREGVLIAAYASALAIGLNVLIAALRLANLSKGYQDVSSVQYSVSLPVGLVIYGIVTPFTEELIFRGVIYQRIKKYFPLTLAIVLNAVVFGFYHGNLVQIVYATIMGMAMAFLYEIYGHLLAPFIFHATANSLVYVFSKADSFSGKNVPVLYACALLMLAAGITVWYIRAWKKTTGVMD